MTPTATMPSVREMQVRDCEADAISPRIRRVARSVMGQRFDLYRRGLIDISSPPDAADLWIPRPAGAGA